MVKNFKVKKYYDFRVFNKKVTEGTIDEISDYTGIHFRTLQNYIKKESKGKRMVEVGTKSQVFAFYKGDELKATGSMRQIAKKLRKPIENVRWYLNKSSQERTGDALIILEGETVIEKRSADKYAPVLTDEKFNPAVKQKTFINKPVKLREFKFDNPWITYQLDGLFKGWN